MERVRDIEFRERSRSPGRREASEGFVEAEPEGDFWAVPGAVDGLGTIPVGFDGWTSSADESFQDGGAFAASRGGEVSLKQLIPPERQKFQASDNKEWQSMMQSGGVRVTPPAQAAKVRQIQPDRIISSRMVRRWKP
eukprot:7378141-Pyramimonas_sp.AAC.1